MRSSVLCMREEQGVSCELSSRNEQSIARNSQGFVDFKSILSSLIVFWCYYVQLNKVMCRYNNMFWLVLMWLFLEWLLYLV